MNTASTTLTAWMVTPNTSASCRVHTTWYTSALTPEVKKTPSSSTHRKRTRMTICKTPDVASGVCSPRCGVGYFGMAASAL